MTDIYSQRLPHWIYIQFTVCLVTVPGDPHSLGILRDRISGGVPQNRSAPVCSELGPLQRGTVSKTLRIRLWDDQNEL